MTDDFASLMPPETPVKRRPGRPTREEAAARLAAQVAREAEEDERRARSSASINQRAEIVRASTGQQWLKEEMFGEPVGMNFLIRVMRMDPGTIKTRLQRCKPAGQVGNRTVWYFHEALPFLVKPKMTAEEFARTLNKADLPPEINSAFWTAQRSRVKYKIEAQEAWETEDVLAVLGDVAMAIKDSLTMVVEELRNRAKLTDEQTEIVSTTIDEIRTEMRRKLVDMPSLKQTGSMHSKPLFGISEDINTTPDIPDTGWLDDDGDDGE
ncbi:DUF1441 family protein [Sphingomonas sp. RB3P16]|uniref:DUF1441 family protein n=1 Tax=Parasphingomonas frigoris TaxID=3096163 RepID=UPI002FC8B4B3